MDLKRNIINDKKYREKYFIASLLFLGSIIFILLYYKDTNAIFTNQYDDAYITYRYAINLASGNGLVFNVGERTDGASSFLYTVLLAFLYWLGFHDLEMVSGIIQVLSAGGISVLVYLSILSLSKNLYVALILAALSVMHGFISGWAINGMETIFYTFLIASFSYFYFMRKKTYFPIVLLILIMLTRIEGILIVLVWFITELFLKVKKKKKKELLNFTFQAACIIFIIVVYFIFKYNYYHTFLPHSLHLKNIYKYYQPNPREILNIWFTNASMVTFLAFYSIIFDSFQKTRSPFIMLYIITSGLSCFLGPRSDMARYTVQIYPLIVILASIPLAALFNYKKFIPLVIIVFYLIFLQTEKMTYKMKLFTTQLSGAEECRKKVGNYLTEKIDNKNVIISSDIGAIGYKAMDFKFIDLTGLTSVNVLKSYLKHQNIDTILRVKKPTYIADTFQRKDDNTLKSYKLLTSSNFLKYDIPESAYKDTWMIDSIYCCTPDSFYYYVVAKIETKF